MKTYFWIVGVPCSGKSYFAEKLAAKLNIPFVHLDCVYDYLPECDNNFTVAYQRMLKINSDFLVIDGIIPFNGAEDMAALRAVLGNSRIIYLVADPVYEQYLENVEKRKIQDADTKPLVRDSYNHQTRRFTLLRPDRTIIVSDEGDLNQITDEDLRSINYQHEGFTNLKWKQLNIDTAGKTVLDLGCSSCFYETYSMNEGAKGYTGLDVNKAYLFNNNAHLFDLNCLENWHIPADIVISTSVYHYLGDKEKFIREAARLTRDTFVFETPLSRLPGRVLECEPNRNLLFPSKSLLEYWLCKYFASVECLGESITEDSSYRLIYHCKK